MTTSYQIVIECDLCGIKAIEEFFDHKDDARVNLMSKLRERGWIDSRNGHLDYALCPVCKTINPDSSVTGKVNQ